MSITNHPKQLTFLELPEIEHQEITLNLENNGDERPDTYTGMYAMHKYWSKKPHNLVARYIERFSKSGELVLDAFSGSGVTIIESVRLKRRAIGIDINPIAVLSTKMGVEHIDLKILKKNFDAIRNEVEDKINELYETQCPTCGNPNAIATHTIWNNGQPVEVWVACKACKTNKSVKSSSEKDSQLAVEPVFKPSWYPTIELIENYRINAKPGTRVCDLFTPRALAALSMILEKIRQIEDVKTRSVLEFCFSAMLPQASNMVFVIRRRGKSNGRTENDKTEVGSWVIGYWTPSEHFEIHVWRCFENRFRRVLKGKQEVNQTIPVVTEECSSYDELCRVQQGYWISKGTATRLGIPSESVDYIFTDPPHGNRIPYLELSLIWNAWLGLDFDWEDEIVISEAKRRQKNVADYRNRLELTFGEMWRVLKASRYISVAFNILDDESWLALLNSLISVGFEVIEISPLEYSARSVVQDTRKNALKTDFVITCQKVLKQQNLQIKFGHSQTYLEKSIQDYLTSRKDGAQTYEILNHLFISNVPTGTIFRVSLVMETLETLALHRQGRWCLKLS